MGVHYVTEHGASVPTYVCQDAAVRSGADVCQRVPGKVEFHEDLCSENNMHVYIGKEGYLVSGDGYLMPTKKDQPED